MIKLVNVSKSWSDFKLERICLNIWDSEYFVILGPTGAGKTLLLELIAGFHTPDEGLIIMGGRILNSVPPEHRRIGFVYQTYMLFPHKDVFENIAYGLKIRNINKSEIVAKVDKISALLGISHLLDRTPATLSSGEQQKVAIARALILKPKVLLLDEPLSALDARTKDTFIKFFKQLHSTMNITVLHVTHDQNVAIALANRIAILNTGNIQQTGTVDEIFRKPKSKFVAEFVGVQNLFEGVGRIKNGITEINVNDVFLYSAYLKSGKVFVSIRPEDIIVSKKEFKHSSARNQLVGKVVEITDKGSVIKVVVNCGINITAYITREAFYELNINIGSEVFLIFKALNVNVF
jgi:molybdopterin-binding protein